MANQSISMNDVKQILILYHQSIPLKQIARQPGMSKNTVKAYIRRFETSGLSSNDFLELSCPELQAKLSSPGLTVQQRYAFFWNKHLAI